MGFSINLFLADPWVRRALNAKEGYDLGIKLIGNELSERSIISVKIPDLQCWK